MLELFSAYLIARRRSPETIRVRMTYMRQLEAMRPDLLACTLTDLEALIEAHPEWKPETVNAATTSMRVFYKWAHRHGHIVHDPSEYLIGVYVPRAVKVLADDEKIRDALPAASLHEQAMILLGRECGLRRTEIATLGTEHRAGDWLRITGKGGRIRRLHMQLDLIDVLDQIEASQGAGYYFRGERSPHTRAETVYTTVLRLTGTPTHALRRRAATSVYQGTGKDIRITQEFLGHSSPTITAIYIDVSDDDLVRASQASQFGALDTLPRIAA